MKYSTQFIAAVLAIFAENPKQTLLITDDEHVFKPADLPFCRSHCNTHDIKFHEMTKEDFEKATSGKVIELKSTTANAPTTQTIVDLSKIDTMKQPGLLKLVKSLGLKSKTTKGVDLLEALKAYQKEQDAELNKEKVDEGSEGGDGSKGAEDSEGADYVPVGGAGETENIEG